MSYMSNLVDYCKIKTCCISFHINVNGMTLSNEPNFKNAVLIKTKQGSHTFQIPDLPLLVMHL